MPDTPLNPEQIIQQSPTLKAAVLAGVKKGARSDAEAVRNYRASRDCIVAALPELRTHFAAALPEVTSVEELEALPVESVVLDADNCVLQILHNGEQYLNGDPFREYCMVGDIRGYESDEVALPARVLYMPEVPGA